MPDIRDFLPPPPWEGPPVPRGWMCPMCVRPTSHYLFMGTEYEAEALAKELDIRPEEVYALKTCAECGFMWLEKKDGRVFLGFSRSI